MKFGIDLGTTNSLITYWVRLPDDTFKLNTLSNNFGSTQTESVVYFEEDTSEVIVGKIALSNYGESPDRAIRWVKRYMGTDKKYDIDGEVYSPQEISAFILKNLKQLAENQGEMKKGELNEIVITVPADFDENAKRATSDAAKIAGFDKIYLIPEPNAAILSYLYNTNIIGKINEKLPNETNYFLVFDLGGGTFDVSLSKLIRGKDDKINISVVSTYGNKYLGGINFDLELLKYILGKIKKTNEAQNKNMDELLVGYDMYYKKNKNIPESMKLILSNLEKQCELLKISLTNKNKQTIYFHNQVGQVVKTVISRDEFEMILSPYFEQITSLIEKVLIDVKSKTNGEFKSWDDLDIALLVGGSSNIPSIKSICDTIFGGKVKSGVNTFEGVSQGAAIYAGIKNMEIDSFGEYKQIVPHDYGIKIGEDKLITILSKGSEKSEDSMEYSIPFALDTKSPLVIAERFYNEDGTTILPEIERINYYHPFILTGDKLKIQLSLDDSSVLTVSVFEPKIDDKVEIIVENTIGLKDDQISKSREKINMKVCE